MEAFDSEKLLSIDCLDYISPFVSCSIDRRLLAINNDPQIWAEVLKAFIDGKASEPLSDYVNDQKANDTLVMESFIEEWIDNDGNKLPPVTVCYIRYHTQWWVLAEPVGAAKPSVWLLQNVNDFRLASMPNPKTLLTFTNQDDANRFREVILKNDPNWQPVEKPPAFLRKYESVSTWKATEPTKYVIRTRKPTGTITDGGHTHNGDYRNN